MSCSTADNALADTTNETTDMEPTAPMEIEKGDLNAYQSSAGNTGIEAPEAAGSENLASVPKDNAVQEYAIEFLEDGAVAVKGNGIFRPDGTVTRFTEPQQDLSNAKTKDGEIYRIRLESNYLYIFGDDLQTAECYKLT